MIRYEIPLEECPHLATNPVPGQRSNAVGYRVALLELKARAEKICPGWVADASGRTRKFVQGKQYDEAKGNWSAIKPILMEIQHNKCAYCERQFAGAATKAGSREYAVDHFRPKSSVKALRPRRTSIFPRASRTLGATTGWRTTF